ncbi:hypothetical protein [Geothrix sp. 21YS21S-4]|uniref:hypothetical protein n=1 Tax=Geothrix sp. 21YS21S-4 TaxID=3068889 RepID=UPI0027B97605|nr:hypothetical protein [Geothrix sp. 21YS21S-4]
MATNGDSPLPHGLKKLDLGGAVLAFLGDKITFNPKKSHYHYTFHFGQVTKVMDVHRTRRVKGEPEVHETLLKIPYERLPTFIEGMGQEILDAYWSVLRPLRIGWMARNRIGAEPALFPSETGWPEVTSARKGRLHIDEEKVAARMGQLEFLDDLYDLPMGQCFSLISCRNPYRWKTFGFGIRLVGRHGQPKLFWCPYRAISRRLNQLGSKMEAFILALQKSGPADNDHPASVTV